MSIHTHTDFSRAAGEAAALRIWQLAENARDQALAEFKRCPANPTILDISAWQTGYATEIVRSLRGLPLAPYQILALLRENSIRGRK